MGTAPEIHNLIIIIFAVLLKGRDSVRRTQRFFILIWPGSWSFVLLALVAVCTVSGNAQHTVVQDAGGGRKMELQYNAAGQVTETRTLGPDGQVLQKDVIEYPPGAYVPQTTSTSYWPNGQIHKLTRNTYDLNANFTGEFVQIYNESEKQIGGHRLTHDPKTGVYECKEWNIAAQDYQVRDCPAGEESSGTPEAVKKFTRDEVMQQLQHARQAASQASKVGTAPGAATQPSDATNGQEVGLVLPAQVRPGQRVSGSVVEDPSKYEGLPEVTVTRIALPFASSGAASTLAGWVLEVSGEPPRPADGPIALTIPPGQVELAFAFHPDGNPGTLISKAIATPPSPHTKAKAPASYQAPALCFKGQLCVVHGPFSGNSSKTFAAFEQRPAKIVAETSDTAYLAIPDGTAAGPRPLLVAEGAKVIAFPVVVGTVNIRPDGRDLKAGGKQLMYSKLEGPEELPDAEWRPGNYPASNLAQAQKLVPGFQVQPLGKDGHEEREAKQKRDAKDKHAGEKGEDEENEGGEILFVVKSLGPPQFTFHQSNKGVYIFHLNAASFKMGDFQYKFVVEANQAGKFDVQAYAIPFLAPVAGQEFALTPAASGK
jgi:YD repeat-containing protein